MGYLHNLWLEIKAYFSIMFASKESLKQLNEMLKSSGVTLDRAIAITEDEGENPTLIGIIAAHNILSEYPGPLGERCRNTAEMYLALKDEYDFKTRGDLEEGLRQRRVQEDLVRKWITGNYHLVKPIAVAINRGYPEFRDLLLEQRKSIKRTDLN